MSTSRSVARCWAFSALLGRAAPSSLRDLRTQSCWSLVGSSYLTGEVGLLVLAMRGVFSAVALGDRVASLSWLAPFALSAIRLLTLARGLWGEKRIPRIGPYGQLVSGDALASFWETTCSRCLGAVSAALPERPTTFTLECTAVASGAAFCSGTIRPYVVARSAVSSRDATCIQSPSRRPGPPSRTILWIAWNIIKGPTPLRRG